MQFSFRSNSPDSPNAEVMSPQTFISEMAPRAIHLSGGMNQLCSFFQGTGFDGFQVVAKEIYQGMTGPLNLSMHLIGASLYLFPTPITLSFRNESQLINGKLVPSQRTLTIFDERTESIFPPVVLTSKPVDNATMSLSDISITLPNGEISLWNTPHFSRLLSAAGMPGNFSNVVKSAAVQSQGEPKSLVLTNVISIDAVRLNSATNSATLSSPVGIPVLGDTFRISRIQIVEPKRPEVEKILALLGGAASVEAVLQSGLYGHAREYFLDPRFADGELLSQVAGRLTAQGRSVELAHTQSAGMGKELGYLIGSPKLRNFRSGIDARFDSLTDLPCGLSLGSDLFTISHPVWHDGKPIDVVLHSMALDFGSSNVLAGLLESFPKELAESLKVELSDNTWGKFQRWADHIKNDKKADVFEMQIGGRLNFTLNRVCA